MLDVKKYCLWKIGVPNKKKMQKKYIDYAELQGREPEFVRGDN